MENIICLCMLCNKNKVIKGRNYCNSCTDKMRSPEAQERRKKQSVIRNTRHRKNNKEKANSWKKNHRKKQKLEVLERYGGKCACCGESQIGFLTIDHINNDGGERRKRNASEINVFEYLFNKPIDLETYQILCFNCNFGKNCNEGICPHKDVL